MAANIRYARNGDVRLAYRVASDGEPDILVTFGWVGSMESPWWDDPANARWMERLFSLGRVILWDKRGTGLSDRVAPDDLPTLEERMDDLRAVMDAAGSERAVLLGMSEGTVLSSLFAATYPERTEALALYGGAPRWVEGEDYPYAPSAEESERFAREICDAWGDNAWLLKLWAPSIADEPGAHARWNEMLVHGASPAAAEAWLRMADGTDIRAALPAIDVPTVVLHRVDDGILPVANGRELGARDPRRPLRRAARRRSPLVGGPDGGTGHPGRGRVVARARPRGPRARAGAGHRDVHRHRRLHAQGRRAGRQPLARPGGHP